MKSKSLMFAILAMFFFSGLSAQVVNIPDKAKNDFGKKHAHAKDAKWENKVAYYIVHYSEGGTHATAHYRMDGTWEFTEMKINDGRTPTKVKNAFQKSKFRNWEVKEKAFVENDNREKLYRYEVKNGVDKRYIFFNKEGKFIKENQSI